MNGHGDELGVLVPGGASVVHLGDDVACLLLHGYTAMPEEVRPLGEHLRRAGRTVVALRLPGHGTHPDDLAPVRWVHHLAAVADAVGLLRQQFRLVVVIGTSMGGVLALSSGQTGLDGIVAVSTPSEALPWRARLWDVVPRLRAKGVPLDPVYGVRRERDYPAYGVEPTRQTAQLHRGLVEMRRRLATIRCPVMLVHSDADSFFPVLCMTTLAADLTGTEPETHVVHGLEHGMLNDPNAAPVFTLIEHFVARVATGVRDTLDRSC